MKIKPPPIRKARIEIIPMIDTIFFLLVFFMITSLAMVKMKAVPLSAPGSAAQASAVPTMVTVSVTADGKCFVDAAKISPRDLTTVAQQHVAAAPGKSVVVVCVAKTQRMQTMMDVMDCVNRVTASDGTPVPVQIATDPDTASARAQGVH